MRTGRRGRRPYDPSSRSPSCRYCRAWLRTERYRATGGLIPRRLRPSPPRSTDRDHSRCRSRRDPYWGVSPAGSYRSGNRKPPRNKSDRPCRRCHRRRSCCCRSTLRHTCRCRSSRPRGSRARWDNRKCPRSTSHQVDRRCRRRRNGCCCSTYRRRHRRSRFDPPRSHRPRRKRHRCKHRWRRRFGRPRSVPDRR
jgi:hypothetical protein